MFTTEVDVNNVLPSVVQIQSKKKSDSSVTSSLLNDSSRRHDAPINFLPVIFNKLTFRRLTSTLVDVPHR